MRSSLIGSGHATARRCSRTGTPSAQGQADRLCFSLLRTRISGAQQNGGQRNAARIRRSPAIIPGRRDNDAAGMSERRLRASGAKYDGNYAVARSFQLSE